MNQSYGGWEEGLTSSWANGS